MSAPIRDWCGPGPCGPGTRAVAVPVAVFLLCVWVLHIRPLRPPAAVSAAFPVTASLVLATMATPASLPLTALLVAGLVVTWILAGGS